VIVAVLDSGILMLAKTGEFFEKSWLGKDKILNNTLISISFVVNI